MTSTDLEPVTGEIEPRAPLLPMMSAAEARGAMAAYQELCAAVLEPEDWIGRAGEPDSFVKRSGWDKLATFYGASVELIGDTILERDPDGNLMRASARARAIDLRTGRRRDGGGACGRNEPRFQNARGRQKIEHDLPSTAETRATNRAIANLIGFGAVSAEEVDADVRAGGPTLPRWAEDIPDAAIERLGENLMTVLAAAGAPDPAGTVAQVGNTITNYCDGRFPAACARLARLLAQAIPAGDAGAGVDREPELASDEAPADGEPHAHTAGDVETDARAAGTHEPEGTDT
jgi:hypothetical protein